ncbi:MAG: C1 family peptidase, partial [Chitinophagaceae bacterium]
MTGLFLTFKKNNIMPTIKELQTQLVQNNARWTVHESLLENNQIPKYRTGGLTENLTIASSVKNLDFKTLLAVPTTNPFIAERRIANKLLLETILPKEFFKGSSQILEKGVGQIPMLSGTALSSVDWRDRFGWPWITSVRDQNGCEACWCFAAV